MLSGCVYVKLNFAAREREREREKERKSEEREREQKMFIVFPCLARLAV